MKGYRAWLVTYQRNSDWIWSSNIAYGTESEVMEYYSGKGCHTIWLSSATVEDVIEAERKGKPIIKL